jgi:hypothetical protein
MFKRVIHFLLVFGWMTILAAQNQPQGKSVGLAFNQESYDFGRITPDSVLYHVFHFKNTGTDTVHIYNVGAT